MFMEIDTEVLDAGLLQLLLQRCEGLSSNESKS